MPDRALGVGGQCPWEAREAPRNLPAGPARREDPADADFSAGGPHHVLAVDLDILQDQLVVGDDEFSACVEDGMLPARGAAPVPAAALHLALVWQLTHTVGMDEGVVARMMKEQAVQAINDYWMSQDGGPVD
ncbi:hypothetical protein [Arthrobacter sp. A5]|uniref:hypothetical protein n=1 Tax=Arthrobacter sp. A5 TaxID=576926 RepID=UPI003DA8ECEE